MQIERVTVKNFRNLADIDLRLEPGTVIVGENQAGKSNLIHAIRLVLDASLSYNDRQLASEDFSDALSDGSATYDPMINSEEIAVSIEIGDFEDDTRLRAVLADALLAEDPLRAKLVYRFAPIDDGGVGGSSDPQYLGEVYGGDNCEKPMPARLRKYLHLAYLKALRDVESDIRNWTKSPLRSLLQRAASAVDVEELDKVQQAMKDANEKLNDLGVIADLGNSITSRLEDMVGPEQGLETELAAAPDDPIRLIRGMRLYIDGDAHRTLNRASLGTLNVLYLGLQELQLDAQRISEDVSIAHVVMAIEEPEAHLHPHLQRLIFRRLLREQGDGYTTLVTTQSPYIASVADPQSLIVLRTVNGHTVASAASEANLDDDEWDDIGRYLDATRAELVFARRVLLVEGFAEQSLIPMLADGCGINLDKQGITICAVHGTHFTTYVKFCESLGIPWAVITDGDPDVKVGTTGADRATALLDGLSLAGDADSNGIFVGATTFEYDLLEVDGNRPACYQALSSLCAIPSKKEIQLWDRRLASYDDYMRVITNAGGKGRFAQRLAQYELASPKYVADALEYLVNL